MKPMKIIGSKQKIMILINYHNDLNCVNILQQFDRYINEKRIITTLYIILSDALLLCVSFFMTTTIFTQ